MVKALSAPRAANASALEDMGNGRSALVVVTDIDGPVYAYKVPKDGL